jgi:hypothetical protein
VKRGLPSFGGRYTSLPGNSSHGSQSTFRAAPPHVIAPNQTFLWMFRLNNVSTMISIWKAQPQWFIEVSLEWLKLVRMGELQQVIYG